MQSITAEDMDGAIGPASELPVGGWRPFARLVLPKPLRRPLRMLRNANWKVPRHIGTKGVALLFAATVVAGTLVGGHVQDLVSAVTAWCGLGIDQVRITGQSRTQELDILHELEIGPFPSLLTFDLEAAKARLETLPWVGEATLRKLYPHDLNVVVRERQPYAVWQSGGKLWLIDDKGHSIGEVTDDAYASLPLVVGESAAARATEFIALLAAAPDLAKETRAGVLVAGRRWTIVLKTGVEVMLPESDPAAALAGLAKLNADTALLSRAIAAVDLRTSGQTVIRLDSEGAAARTALLKARSKLPKART